MNHRALHLQVCFLVLFVAGGVARAQEPRLPANIRGLSVNYKNGSLLVSFRVEGAFSPPVLEKLASASVLLRRTLREADIACRLSGTRFAMILEIGRASCRERVS